MPYALRLKNGKYIQGTHSSRMKQTDLFSCTLHNDETSAIEAYGHAYTKYLKELDVIEVETKKLSTHESRKFVKKVKIFHKRTYKVYYQYEGFNEEVKEIDLYKDQLIDDPILENEHVINAFYSNERVYVIGASSVRIGYYINPIANKKRKLLSENNIKILRIEKEDVYI